MLRRLDCILTEDDRKDKAIDAHNCFKDVWDIIENFNLDRFIDWFYSAIYDSFQPWTDGSAHHNSRKIPIALLIPESGNESGILCNDITSSETDCAL